MKRGIAAFLSAACFAVPALAAGAEAAPAAPRNYFLELYIPQILAVMAGLVLLSHAAEKRFPDRKPALRKAWNWLLLLSFAFCVLPGLCLLIPLGKTIKYLLLDIHVWAGAVCVCAGTYHACRRFSGLFGPRR